MSAVSVCRRIKGLRVYADHADQGDDGQQSQNMAAECCKGPTGKNRASATWFQEIRPAFPVFEREGNMNITSITEFKEPRLVDPKSLLCTQCGLNNPEHVKLSICSHCRVSPKGQRIASLGDRLQVTGNRFRRFFTRHLSLFTRHQKDSVVKDRKSSKCDALPPSVISD